MKKFILPILILTFATILYGYTQYLKKETISAVLQNQVNLDNDSNAVFAISTLDQNLPSGRNFPRGTIFTGKIAKEDGYKIYFNSYQTTDGKQFDFSAKTSLNMKAETPSSGVSAKISKTLYKQTKSNVLGAIFKTSQDALQHEGTLLPKGYLIKIEVD